MQKYKFLLLSATPYNMVDERTGAVNAGISINYLPTDNLAPSTDTNGIGYKPAKGSLPLELMKKIGVAPGIYEFTFDMRIVANKPQLKMIDIDFVSLVALSASAVPIPTESKPEESKPEESKPEESKASTVKSGK